MHLQLSHITDLTVKLQETKEKFSTANEAVMQRVEKLSTENGDLSINNAALKVQAAKRLVYVNYCENKKNNMLNKHVHNYNNISNWYEVQMTDKSTTLLCNIVNYCWIYVC